MTEFQDHARLNTGSEQAHGRRRAAGSSETSADSTRTVPTVRTRVVHTPAPAAPARRAAVMSVVRRAAVVTASCAVLIGAAAAGQAGGNPMVPASAVQAHLPAGAATITPTEALASAAAEQAAMKADPAAPEAAPAPEAPAPAPAEAAPAPEPEAALAPAAAAEPEPVAVNDPAGAQAYALGQLGSYGWGAGQMPCLTTLWTKESDWSTTATNPSSGAYGIVQSLPAEKMASAGADYLTNYRTQINWGLNYIQERYQSPCGALNFHLANNWY